MKRLIYSVPRHLRVLLFTSLSLGASFAQGAVIQQAPAAGHVAFEAENSAAIITGTPTSWEVRSDPAASGASALYAGGVNNVDLAPHSFVQYQIKFAAAGTYYLYHRWKADPARTAGDVFTANSSWMPRDFGAFNTPGAAGRDPFYNSAANGTQAPANNVYAWQAEPEANAYTVTQAQVSSGTPLILTIGSREAGMFFDRIILSTAAGLTGAALDALPNSETDLIVQDAGQGHVAFEAEAKGRITPGTPTSWEVRSDPAASGASALYAGGVNNVDLAPHSFVQYQIKFAAAGTYYLYHRWKADPARTAGDVFTANSSWMPRDFGAFNTPGAAGRDPFYNSAANGTQAPANNVYAWQAEPEANAYTVTPAQVSAGTPLIFTIGSREAGMFFDRIILSTTPGLTAAALDALPNSGAAASRPELARAVGSASLDTVTLAFTRPLAPATVRAQNFALSGGVTVTGAVLEEADSRQVRLTTSAQSQGTVYTVTVNNVTDTSGNAVAANATITFTGWKEVRGWVKREIYFGISGPSLDSLWDAANYPDRPDRVEWIRSFHMSNDPLTDNYAARLTAFFHPPAAGTYDFFHSNDDEAELLLSTDATPENLVSLGVVPLSQSAGFNDGEYLSGAGPLMANGKYLLQGVLKQGGGDVRLSVAARRQGSNESVSSLQPLAGDRVSSFVNPDLGKVTFEEQPASTTVPAGDRARLSVSAEALATPIYYQWRLNGVDIPGATRPVYTTPVLTQADSGRKYTVTISVAGVDTASAEATVSVTPGDPSPLQPYLGINFVGGGTGGGGTLSAVDVAGAVPQERWNNIIGSSGDSIALRDASGAATPVTLSFEGTQSWYSGTGAGGDADGAMLQGYVNNGNSEEPLTFTFTGVPPGNYAVLVYSVGFTFQASYEQAYSVTGSATYPPLHVKAQTGFEYTQNPGLHRMSSTNPNARQHGNYVQIEGVSPAADGTLSVAVASESSNPGNGHLPAVNAIQLVRVQAVTQRPSLAAAQAQAGTLSLSWSAAANGFTLESTASLTPGQAWSQVAGAPNPINGAGSVNINTTGNGLFYRLRRP